MFGELVLRVLRGVLQPVLWPRLVECGVVLGLSGWIVGARLGGSRAAAALAGLAGCALALAISVTLLRGGGQPGALGRLRFCAVTEPHLLSPDGVANLALLAPTALLAVLAVGRPVRVTVLLTAVSLLTEATQAVRGVGVCDSSDALLNGVGALAAAIAATAIRNAVARGRSAPEPFVSGSVACRRSC